MITAGWSGVNKSKAIYGVVRRLYWFLLGAIAADGMVIWFTHRAIIAFYLYFRIAGESLFAVIR